jgi:hypothetical protein
MPNASFPRAIAGWQNRIDNVDIVWANDPNSLAAEIISIENTLGHMPHVEKHTAWGPPVTYNDVSDRISAVQLGAGLPYSELIATNFRVGYGAYFNGVRNTYRPLTDDFGFFNGTDMTMFANGIFVIDVMQVYQPWSNGFLNVHLTLNGNLARTGTWSWDSVPTNGPRSWENRTASAGLAWMGPLQYGDRVSVVTENGTGCNPYLVQYSSLRCQYIRSLSSYQASLEPSASPM